MVRWFNQKGMSLIEIMIGAGIASFIALAIATVLANQYEEFANLRRKLDAIDLEKLMQSAFTGTALCTDLVTDTNYTFNSTSPTAVVDILRIRTTTDYASPILVEPGMTVSTGLQVRTVRFVNFRPAGGNTYRVSLEVAFQDTANKRLPKPILQEFIVDTDPTTPPAARKISSCNQTSSSGGGGSTGTGISGILKPLSGMEVACTASGTCNAMAYSVTGRARVDADGVPWVNAGGAWVRGTSTGPGFGQDCGYAVTMDTFGLSVSIAGAGCRASWPMQ